MGGRTKVHLSLWLISVLVIFCQDTEAKDELTTPSATTPPPPPPPSSPSQPPMPPLPPMQPVVMYGADTDKDNMKGKVPWRILPFKTDKDKYKPYIIYPAPKQMYPPKFMKPPGYVDKDWDPPKKKDDVKHKKKPKDLDDIPKPKTDKKKKLEDMMDDKNRIMYFLSMPGYASKCLDGDKKFLDDKSECKRMKKDMAWAGKGPAMGTHYYPQRRPPWQSNSFVGEPLYFKPPVPFQTPDPSNPNYYPFFQTPEGIYAYGPNGYINPYGPDGYIDPYVAPFGSSNPYVPPFGSSNPYVPPFGSSNPYVPPFGSPNPYAPSYPYPPYQYRFPLKGAKPPPYPFPYNKYPNVFANVNTESPTQEPEEKKQEPVAEPMKDKPENKEQKSTTTEEPKKITKDLTLIKSYTSPILP